MNALMSLLNATGAESRSVVDSLVGMVSSLILGLSLAQLEDRVVEGHELTCLLCGESHQENVCLPE
jgi:hypothetical protein